LFLIPLLASESLAQWSNQWMTPMGPMHPDQFKASEERARASGRASDNELRRRKAGIPWDKNFVPTRWKMLSTLKEVESKHIDQIIVFKGDKEQTVTSSPQYIDAQPLLPDETLSGRVTSVNFNHENQWVYEIRVAHGGLVRVNVILSGLDSDSLQDRLNSVRQWDPHCAKFLR
jgi:hypothetical protein